MTQMQALCSQTMQSELKLPSGSDFHVEGRRLSGLLETVSISMACGIHSRFPNEERIRSQLVRWLNPLTFFDVLIIASESYLLVLSIPMVPYQTWFQENVSNLKV